MKNLALGSLIALGATQAAGCVIDNSSPADTATISATWTFRNEASGTAGTCPGGYDTVALYNKTLDGAYCDPTSSSPSDTCIELFDCAAGSGVSAPLAATQYKTWLVVTNHDNTSQWGQSTEATVDVTVSDKTFSAQFLLDGGYFLFAWDLIGDTTHNPLTCASAPGGVSLVATDVADSSYFHDDDFDCQDGADYTAGYRAGTYTVSVSALNAANQSIGTAPALPNEVIGTRNMVTNLGTVQIPITGM